MGNARSTDDTPPTPPDNRSDDGAPPPDEQQMSYWQMAKQGYQELVNAIIRPPRCQYETYHLGPPQFQYCGRNFTRTDFQLTNRRGLTIQCSWWEPEQRPSKHMPCVIYMHGNSSARVEALPQLSLVLALGATLVAFDFAGSGKSEGQYVSLGFYEKDDLQCVIEHLRETEKVSTIALWGRSMGAATALLHGERDPSIAAMVLDSAFASLRMLAEEMVEKGRQHGLRVPNFIVHMAIRFIRSSVRRAADFDIDHLSPITHADRCYIPAVFIAGKDDDFVPQHHSREIYNKYAGDKNIIIVEGDHNSMRPQFLFDSIGIFLTNTLQIPESWGLECGTQSTSRHVPWERSRAPVLGAFSFGHGNNDALHELDEDEIGMTEERQAQIQAALLTMFGDGEASTRRAQNGRTSLETQSPEDMLAAEEWSCSICTLMNSPLLTVCSACGFERSCQ